jgi:hypothetical protein
MGALAGHSSSDDFLSFIRRTRSHADPDAPASAQPSFVSEQIPFGGQPIRGADGTIVDYTPTSRMIEKS